MLQIVFAAKQFHLLLRFAILEIGIWRFNWILDVASELILQLGILPFHTC